jgi:hypothetical protein
MEQEKAKFSDDYGNVRVIPGNICFVLHDSFLL